VIFTTSAQRFIMALLSAAGRLSLAEKRTLVRSKLHF
jgi:hypothetical protein